MSLFRICTSTRTIIMSTIETILLFGQLVEDDDVVNAVQELGPEVLLELVVDLLLHPVVVRRRVVLGGEPHRHGLRDVPGAEVRGEDEHGVLEVHDPALAVGQAVRLPEPGATC
jgi:hypothetical protein